MRPLERLVQARDWQKELQSLSALPAVIPLVCGVNFAAAKARLLRCTVEPKMGPGENIVRVPFYLP